MAHTELRFDRQTRRFMLGTQKVRGLLRLLADRYYPHYSYTGAIYNRDHGGVTEHAYRKHRRPAVQRERGRTTGIRVDQEIAETVELLNRIPTLPLACFWSKAERLRTMRDCTQKERDLCSSLLPQTQQFWKAVRRRCLIPINTQTPLGYYRDSTRTRVEYATALDVECVDSTGRVVLIEVKCGFTSYLRACTLKKMLPPFTKKTTSPLNQHQLQLANTVFLYRHNYPERRMGQHFVVYLDGPLQAKIKPLQPWVSTIKDWRTPLSFVPPSKKGKTATCLLGPRS